MPKFSVKKPLTIFVAVIAILVMGVVSFMNMTPDLLPNINLPYVMVITACPGQTPEKVETMVTKPMEQAMATLENIETVSSTSSENSSLVVLEFTEDVNMDTVAVDILQLVNQISGYWDETVSTPIIMKLNPSMLPVMVSAVDMDGMDTAALSEFMEDTLINELEGIPGVASVNASGLVEENLEVVLNQEKIDAQNKKIKEAIENKFSEAEAELDDAKGEVESGLSEVAGAKSQKDSGLGTLTEKTAEAGATIDEKNRELSEGKRQLEDQLAQLEQQLETMKASRKSLKELQKSITQMDQKQQELEEAIAGLQQLQQTVAQLEEAERSFNEMIAGIENSRFTPEQRAQLIETVQALPGLSDLEKAAYIGIIQSIPEEATREQKDAAINAIKNQAEYQQVQAGLAAIDAQLAARPEIGGRAGIAAALQQAEDGLLQIKIAQSNIDATLMQNGIKSRSEIGKAIKEIDKGIPKLEEGIATLKDTLAQLESGQMQLDEAKKTLDSEKTKGLVELSEGSAQLTVAESELKKALTEIEAGYEQMEDAKEDAAKQADLDNILTMEMLTNLLKAQNFSMPAGYVTDNGAQALVRVGDTIQSFDDLDNLVLLDMQLDGLAPIYLTDVADLRIDSNLDSIYAKVNGNDGVLLTFQKQSTYATATVSENIQESFAALQEEYPGLSFVGLMDQGDYIFIIVNSILENLLLGALFAIIVLFLFLRDIRPTFITLCSIPISVIFALALMYFTGVTINIISLSGLAVSVGMLVDNSVVVIENIYRLRNKGMSAVKAAVSGASQVAGAIAASTLTTICVFLPIVFTQGLTRELFTDMALTIAYSLIASLIVALTLVPAMSAGMLKNTRETQGRVMDGFLKFYDKTVRAALKHKAPVLLISAVLLVASIVLVLARGYTFMPGMDMPEVTATLTAPEGSELKDTRAYADEAGKRIEEINGVKTVGAMLAGDASLLGGMGGAGGDSDPTEVTFYVLLDEEIEPSGNKVAREINALFEDADYTVSADSSGSMTDMMSAMSGSGVSINVYGNNLDDLQAAARQVAETLETVPGAVDVDNGIGDTDPEIRFIVDKNKAMAKGLTTAQVFAKVSEALSTESNATTLSTPEQDYDVLVVSGNTVTLTPDYIKNFSFMHENLEGEEERIYLRDIAEIVDTETTRAISRLEQRRYITVSAGVEEGSNVGLVATAAEEAMASQTLPEGITLEYTGENETVLEAFGDLMLMLLMGVLLVYLIMVAQFQSLKSPFIVMFTIPLAFTGGFFALLFTGMELSVIALIGFVMLVGIIVNNGIVLVDYINQLRAEGMETYEATVEAGRTRMRPILMTTITTVLGLSVMALGRGTGSELMQPIAIVCIGGLVYATLLTLYVVPIMYTMLNRKKFRQIDEEDLIVSDE